jgi:phospholipase/lecithinase/hemolysin/uncharacterized protein YhjY with autotransporter beta-barrel domain
MTLPPITPIPRFAGRTAALASTGLLALFASTALAGPIDQIYVFGDSSADVGSTPLRATNAGSLWDQTLAAALGRADTPARSVVLGPNGIVSSTPSTGTNYAIVGATVQDFGDSATLSQEISAFAQDHRRFSAKDLVLVWATRNDISDAYFDSVSYDPKAYAAAYKGDLDRLHALGARDLVAFNGEINLLPVRLLDDAGVPSDLVTGLQTETLASNAAMAAVYKADNVFVIDMNRLGNAVLAHPAKFGFLYTTDSYIGRGDPNAPGNPGAYPNDGNVFDPNGHYSSAMQTVIGDYVLAELRGREQILDVLEQTKAMLGSRVDGAEGQFQDGFSAREQGGASQARPTGVWRVYGGLATGDGYRPATGSADVNSTARDLGGALGGDVLLAPQLLVGLQISQDHVNAKFANDTGGFVSNATLATFLAAYRVADSLTLRMSGGYGWVDHDKIERRAALRSWDAYVDQESTRGSTRGYYESARLSLTYDRPLGAWQVSVGPRLSYERYAIKAYAEASGVLAMAYGDSAIDDVRAGVAVAAERQQAIWGLRPFVSASYDRDLNTKDYKISVGADPSLIVSYGSARPYTGLGSASMGAVWSVGQRTTMRAELFEHVDFAAKPLQASGVALAFSARF